MHILSQTENNSITSLISQILNQDEGVIFPYLILDEAY